MDIKAWSTVQHGPDNKERFSLSCPFSRVTVSKFRLVLPLCPFCGRGYARQRGALRGELS